MDFSFYAVRIYASSLAKRLSIAQTVRFRFGKPFPNFIYMPGAVFVLGQIFIQPAYAAGDPVKGAANWDYLCNHCHGTPQPNSSAAFRAYGTTANPLSLYASNPVAITRATNRGYTIPSGNTNDDYEPGTSTARAMESFVGMGEKHMGVGDVPSQYAIDISAYLATYFEVPGAPIVSSVLAGNAQATVNFNAPKSDLTITGYTVTCNPGGLTATGTASPITVQGLVNGTAYTFTVTATSNAGAGKPSSASNSITPVAATQAVALPSTPAVAAAPANVPISKPASPVTSLNPVAVNPSGVARTAPATIAVTKTASVSTAPAGVAAPKSAVPDNPVLPVVASAAPVISAPAVSAPASNVAAAQIASTSNSSSTAASIPAPSIVTAKPGSASARVFFTVPQNAAALISSYTVVAYAGGVTTGIKVTGLASPITVTGLTNGSDYSFYVIANGKSGTRAASALSNIVTPLGIFGN